MDHFMELLTSNKKDNGDSLWTSFCNKNKSSVKMLSRNGISTTRGNNSKVFPGPGHPSDIFHISDNEVQDFVKEATNEMFQSGDGLKSADVPAEGAKSNIGKTFQRVVTLNLSPLKETEEVLVVGEDEPEEICASCEKASLCDKDPPVDNSPKPVSTDTSTSFLMPEPPSGSKKALSAVEKVAQKEEQAKIDEKQEVLSKHSYLEVATKLCDLREKIIFSLEDITSSLLPTRAMETDDLEIIKQKKRALEFGARFSRNHLYQLSRLADEIRYSDGNKDTTAKIVYLHNAIVQATLAFVKGAAAFPIEFCSDKLLELLKLVINAMTINTCYDEDRDLEVKDQAKEIIQMCNQLVEDLKELKETHSSQEKKGPIPKSKKKGGTTAMKVKNVKKAPGKPNNLSMYNSVLPKSSRKSPKTIRPKKPVGNKCPDEPPETKTIPTEAPVESKVVEDKKQEEQLEDVNKVNTNFQEALLDILRDMTKQQMQQIFRPVLHEFEVMIRDKAPPDETETTTELMKRFNDFLFQKTCASTNGPENTDGDDDKKTGDRKVVQDTCQVPSSNRSQRNKYETSKSLKEQVQKDKLDFLQQTMRNPMYGNESFSKPWKTISRTSDNILTEMTEAIMKQEMLGNVESFVHQFLKSEMST